MLKLFVISLSFWLAMASTLQHLEVWMKRIICAIREIDIEYEMFFFRLAFYWMLFLLSIMI